MAQFASKRPCPLMALVFLFVSAAYPSISFSQTANDDFRKAQRKLAASIDRTLLDPEFQAEMIGDEPQALFHFVQTEIKFEPYRGVLRGAKGTLLAKAGNAADRALLLAALLESGGHTVRFATADLPSEKAAALLQLASNHWPSRKPAFELLREIDELAIAHFYYLDQQLAATGFEAPNDKKLPENEALNAAQNHVWIQVRTGNDWMDLDPSPGVQFGERLVSPVQSAEVLDVSLYHTVEFTLEVESRRDNRVIRRTVLDHTRRVADLAGVPIGLFHEIEDRNALPILVVGGQKVQGESFETNLEIEDTDGIPLLPRSFDPFERARRATGQNDTGTGASSTPSAAWLHVKTRGPSHSREATYTMFDSVGSAGRMAGMDSELAPEGLLDALVGTYGIVVAGGWIPAEVGFDILTRITNSDSKADIARLLTLPAFTYFTLRGRLPTSVFETQPHLYINLPNIFISYGGNATPRAEGTPGLDLTVKNYKLLWKDGEQGDVSQKFVDNFFNGIVDHSLERVVGGLNIHDRSVGKLFEDVANQGISVQILSATNTAPSLTLSRNGAHRALRSVNLGKVILIPERRPNGWNMESLGWWEVDTATGWTQDTNEAGRHQTTTEPPATTSTQSISKTRAALCLAAAIAIGSANLSLEIVALTSPDPTTALAAAQASKVLDWVEAQILKMVNARCRGLPISNVPAPGRSVRPRVPKSIPLPKGNPYPRPHIRIYGGRTRGRW